MRITQLSVTEVDNGMENCASVQVINLVGIMVYEWYGLFDFDTGDVSFQFGMTRPKIDKTGS